MDKSSLVLEEWMAAAWGDVLGVSPRAVDVLLVQQRSDDTFDSQADAIAELLWDHWMGEPAEPSLEQVRDYVVEVGEAEVADQQGQE